MAAQLPDPTALLLEFIQKYGDGSGQLPPEVRKKMILFALRDLALPEVNDLSGLDIPYKYVEDTYNAIHKNKPIIKEAVIAGIEAGLAAYFALMKVLHRAFPGGVIPAIEGILRDSEGASPHRTQAAHHHAAHHAQPYRTQAAAHPGHEHHYTPEHGAAPHQTEMFGIHLDFLNILMGFISKYLDGRDQLPRDDRKIIVHFIINAIGESTITDVTGLKIPHNYLAAIYDAAEKETVAIKAAAIAAMKAGLKAYEAYERIMQDAFPGGVIPAIESVLHQAEGASPHRTQAAHHPYHTQHGASHLHPHYTQAAHHPYHTQAAPHVPTYGPCITRPQH